MEPYILLGELGGMELILNIGGWGPQEQSCLSMTHSTYFCSTFNNKHYSTQNNNLRG